MRSLCALLALSSGLAEPSFIVRFHEYRPLGEHVASLASLLGRPRAPRRAADPRAAPRGWAPVARRNPAIASGLPTDFVLVRFAGPVSYTHLTLPTILLV